jgi:hypothetical protein
MANDELRKQKGEAQFFEKLFGDVAELNDEELDLLYTSVAPGESPSVSVYRIAEGAAMHYRKQGKVPPEHVQAALDATRPEISLQGAARSALQQVVAKLRKPVLGPVSDPAYAHRHLTGVTDEDRAVLDNLTKQLQKDWEKEKSE